MRKPNNSTGIFAIMLLTLCIIMMQTAFSQTDCDPPCEQPIDSSEPDVSGNRSNPCSNIISLGAGGPANLQYFVQNGTGEWPTSFCYTQVCNGKEQIYSFTAPHTGIYKIEITYTNFQLVAYHWKSGPCSSSGWDCISLPHNPGTYGNMNWTAGNTYYILLDARDALLANHQFYLNVPEAPGTWYGTFNSNWHLSNNWSGGIVPDETVDVIIPSGTNFQPNVQNNNAKCKSLTVQANATLNIGAYELHAHGAVNIHGALNMTSTLSKLRTESDINWHPGSSASLTASSTIFVRGNWEFMNGANIQLNTGFVDFFGSGNSYMRTRDAGSHFYHVRNNKAGTLLGHSGASTQPCRINGNLYIYTNCKLISNISQNIQLGGFVSNMSGMIELSNGTFVFGGAGSISYFMPGDYFNHVTVNSTGTTTFDNNIEIRGNLLIQSGVLSVGNKTITLKGNWTNNAFPTGFDAGTGRVIFNGSGHQYVYSNENFNILEANMGAALRIDNASRVVTCNQYHWTAGGIDVIAGTFTAGDLAQNGIYGGFWLGTSNATINLINSTGSTWVDLRGQIYNYGGTLNLSGTIADWPYANGAHLEMTGGVIDFKTCGLTIYNSYAWTHNITGGTIRLSRWYSGNRADFTPTAGTFEFYGSTDFNITQSNGSTLHHVKINKGARDGDEDQINGPVYDERSNELLSDGSRANTISLASNISITGNLDIDAGTFSIGQYTCDIGGNTNITGTLAMTHASGLINAYGNVTWKTGSTANFTAMSVFNVWGHWNFQSGSNANLANGVVAFAGSSNKYVTNHSLESSFNNISSYKTTGFKVGIEHSSSSPLTINGNIYVHPNAGFGIYSLFNVILKGDVNSDGDFHCNFGTVVLNGVDQNLRMNTGNYFRNLKFNQNGTVTIDNSLSNILDVKRNVVIQSGVFNMQDRIMHVGGNWTNDVGTAAFNEGTGRVIFNGTGDQTCNSETFNILEVNKASGTLNFPGTTVCASYDWTAGGIIVNGGTFTATDLADNGLFGSYTVSNGTINLHQDDGQYVDFAGDITIGNGGVLNVYGGSMMSYWPFFSDASLTMTGNAILDIKDQGILVSNNAHSFTTNITGGTIRTSGGFQGNRADFTPTAGTFEFYGSGNRNISQSNGSKLHHVLINKSAKDGGEDTGSVPVYDKRSGALLSDGGKTNTINLGSNFSLTGSLNITSGSLDVGPYQLDVADDINIHDHLIMTNSAAVVNVGDEIIWHPGSTDMINNGNIYCYIWTFEEGTLAMLEPGNTVHVSGGIYNYDLDAEFGHLIWEDWNTTRNNKVRSKSAALQERIVENETGIANNENPIKEPLENGKTSYPRKVSGNCSWLGSGWLHWEDIIVQGTADITSGCSVELGNMISLTTFSDFTLNGALKLAGGNCYVDGLFHIAGTGELIIQGGEFIVENGSTSYNNLYGTLTMTDGLFQTDINLRIQSTASTNISGGMIRARVFLAESAGTFEPAGGTVEIQTFNNGYGTVKCSNGNFFNNLNVNEAGNGGGAKLMTDIMIVNDLNIYKGNLWFFGFAASVNGNVNIFEGGLYMKDPNDVLNAGNDPADEILWTSDATFEWNEMGRINIFGNCTIENGVSHNVKADQTFAFVGTLNQVFNNLDDATFGTIELAKPSGALIIPVGSTVECEIYDWTSGIITLNSGTFTANDLADDGIYGTIRALGNAVVNLYQDAGSPVHLNGHLEALGSGTINVYGGNDWSNWGTVSDASVTMNGGTINFADQGILVQDNPPWQFTSNITGGTIKTSGSFRAWSPGFNPSGGTVELYGSGWVELSGNHGGYFNNLLIDKTTGSYLDISDIKVNENLIVVNGSLKLLPNKTLECPGSISLNSYLSVQTGAAIQLGNNSTFNANTDGMLHFSGSEEEKAKLTGITASDHYDIQFNSGSFLIAAQGIFENMGEQGVNFASGSEILLMTDCEFRNGKTGSNPMLTIDNNQDLVLENITFNGSSKASQFNVRKNVNEGSVFFLDSTGDMAGETFEDDTHGRIHWMPANHASDPQTIGNDVAICEDAFYMLTVADLVVESGGSADLIASQRIKILPGTHIMSGGNMHAWITESYEFCEQQQSMLASVSPADEEENSVLPAMWFSSNDDQYNHLKMYPNPTSGIVNIELNGLNPDEEIILQVYGITGDLREQLYHSGAQTLSLDLSGWNPGVYLIRILDGNKSFTGKIIKQ